MSSPLARAAQTATAIATRSGVSLMLDPRLIDRDYGHWAGRSQQELMSTYGSLDAAPGVEPAKQVVARARQALDACLKDTQRGPVVLVSHDAVIRMLLASLDPALGSPDDIPQRTACWNLITGRAGEWIVERIDQKVPWN